MSKPEPLLEDNPNRYVMFPIEHQDMWDMAVRHREAFWNESEVDLSRDLDDWNNKLTDNERHFIEHILAFFAGSDGIVLENLNTRFCNEVQVPEARAFYSYQQTMETIHSIVYSNLLDTYISDPRKKDKMFNAIHTVPSIKKKASWAQKWINSEESFATRLVAFACVEGIFFSGAFCSIFWLVERGVLPGLSFSNEMISRDEALHCEFAVMLYTRHIVNKLSHERLHEIVKDAVDIEREFITESLPCDLLGINAKKMTEYIQFVANRLLIQLQAPILYPHAKNPFPFMDRICAQKKANFFERRVSQYRMSVTNIDTTLDLNADF